MEIFASTNKILLSIGTPNLDKPEVAEYHELRLWKNKQVTLLETGDWIITATKKRGGHEYIMGQYKDLIKAIVQFHAQTIRRFKPEMAWLVA